MRSAIKKANRTNANMAIYRYQWSINPPPFETAFETAFESAFCHRYTSHLLSPASGLWSSDNTASEPTGHGFAFPFFFLTHPFLGLRRHGLRGGGDLEEIGDGVFERER